MIALALLLAAAHPGKLPDPARDYAAYVKYTEGQFVCDDEPYRKGCGNEGHRLQAVRAERLRPSCSEPFAQHILRDPQHRAALRDPFVARFLTDGETIADARQDRATWVVETCTDEGATIRAEALAELIRVDQAYDRIRHPTARQTTAYLSKVEQLSPLACPNGMNDDDGNGNVGCD
jgi:hypothetical protein